MVAASQPEITIIKFKRERSCYTVPLWLDDVGNKTVAYLVHQLVSAINSSGGLNLEQLSTSPRAQDGVQVSASDMSLALPKIKENPYANEWVPIDDDSVIQTVIFNDHDTIVFKHNSDLDYHLQQIEYQE